MADTKTTLTWLLRDQVSGTAKQINGQLDAMGVKAKGASGILGELGNVTGGLINPMTLGASAVFGVGAALVTTVKASIQQEEAYRRLDTSLKANASNWDGNTRKVDDSLVAIEGWSGFAKDDLRNSLSLLVGATHDVNKALDVQSVAMDLARYKGISLQDATDALTRVEGGSYRILKSLGIELPKTATQVQALAAVEALAAGQAKDYGDSHAGALDKISNTWNDTVANVGGGVVTLGDIISNTLDPSRIPNPFVHLASESDIMAKSVIQNQKDIDQSIKITGGLVDNLAGSFGNITDMENAMTDWLAHRPGGLAQGNVKRTPKPKPTKKHPHPVNPNGVQIGGTPVTGPHAAGGWVGLDGPEFAYVGDAGPEFITPASRMRSGGSGFTIQGVSEAQLVAMVERGLYFKLSRSSPSSGRS